MFKQDCVMLLAHLSAKYPGYSEKAADSDAYKIMDNSIIELGSAFSMEQLIAEARKCRANEIILPDVYRDAQATIQRAKDSILWLEDHGCADEFRLMAVAHGRDLAEVAMSILAYKNMPRISVIGIPKVLSTFDLNRIKIASYARNMTGKEVHLLGCWYTLGEYRYKDLSDIRSTDTCLPSILAKTGKSAWDLRLEDTLDLENDEVDPEQYKKVMEEFFEGIIS